jgi:arsenical pump membrane protein
MLRPALGRARRIVSRVAAWWLPVAAAAVLLTGLLPLPDATGVLRRIGPVLLFLAAVTVVAELSDAAGLFEVAADVAARAGRGRVLLLWALVVVLATGTTVVLSLDTTAVLLTSVVLALADRLRLPALPFALTTVWFANTASLLLPVSNLTNLLAAERTGWSAATWASRAWAPALACVGVTALVLWLLHRTALRGSYAPGAPPRVAHRRLLRLAAACCGGLGAAVTLGAPPWAAAGVAAVLLGAGFARAAPERLTASLVPVRLLAGTVAMFLLVAVAERHGLSAFLARAVGSPADPSWPDLLRVAGVGAAAANAVNNLPAYLAVEPAVSGSPRALLALVLGVNAGALITPWGSLATLLWWERCRARGVTVRARRFVACGLLLTVPVLVVATAALAWSG